MPDYKELRNKYHPRVFGVDLRVIFIFESPNNENTYFYNEQGVGNFYNNILGTFFEDIPINRAEGLEKFARCGLFLVDATYQEIAGNDNRTIIKQSYCDLKKDLKQIIYGYKPCIILVTQNVLDVLELVLSCDGFNVVNENRLVPFPGYNNANIAKFRDIVGKIIKYKCLKK